MKYTNQIGQVGKHWTCFENAATQTVVDCAYDSQGRRFEKKVTVAGATTLHHRYIYRGYLQIAALDLTRSAHPALWFVTWDPSQPTATRPLALQKDGTWFTYGYDLTKNICEVFGPAGYIRTAYSYAPFGAVTESGDVTQPFQWSSEYYDSELDLVYYNYRHYSPSLGRFLSRDPIAEQGGLNLHSICFNRGVMMIDHLGASSISSSSGILLPSDFNDSSSKAASPQGVCVIQVCCKPVATFTRAHCVIRFLFSDGTIGGCRGGPTGVGNSSGAGGSSGSSGSGKGNGQSSHCKGCCGEWGNVVAGCGFKSSAGDALSSGISTDLEDAEKNPSRCETVAIVSNRMGEIMYSCIQSEMSRITNKCYIYEPLSNNSNTTWKSAFSKCLGGNYDPSRFQPGNESFDESKTCVK